jgi:hypothetical protein
MVLSHVNICNFTLKFHLFKIHIHHNHHLHVSLFTIIIAVNVISFLPSFLLYYKELNSSHPRLFILYELRYFATQCLICMNPYMCIGMVCI